MEGLVNNSFLMSPLYRVILFSAMLPSVYFIMMVVGGMRRSFGLSFFGVIFRTLAGWMLIMGIYVLCGLLFRLTLSDLGAFVEAKVGSNPFVRYYPVAVLIIALAGFWYPRADFFNINRSFAKRVFLFFLCFMPLYLMLGYMLLVKPELWWLCFRFGFKSSMLAFIISFPVIFCNEPSGLTQALFYVVQFLFRGKSTNSRL